MNKYDELIDKLASQMPELADADAFCDDIMERLPERNLNEKRVDWIGILRWTTSIAAVFLLVLFIEQKSSSPTLNEEPDYTHSIVSLQSSFEQINNSTSISETINRIVKEKQNRISISQIKNHISYESIETHLLLYDSSTISCLMR